MNHAERVKAPLRHLDGPDWAMEEAIEELDAMQSALDDAVAKAKFLGDELERVTEERNAAGEAAIDALAHLAARDAEVERLREALRNVNWLYENKTAVRRISGEALSRTALSEEVKGGE